MKKTIALILLLAVSVACFSSCAKEDDGLVYFAKIEVEDYGTITVQLDDEQAPKTVRNFIELSEKGFYDGTTFHRIISGFMIQGGAPRDGYKRNVKYIKGEFADNGVQNNIRHTRGVISMARGVDYNSATTQFFIVQTESDHLDDKYAAFGYVVEGINVVDIICFNANPTDDNGSIKKESQPVIKTITIFKDEPIVVNGDYDDFWAEGSKGDTSSDASSSESEFLTDLSDFETTHEAVMTIKDIGTVKIALFGKEAPITVENFVNLANNGFYNGLSFHRIIEGFMMQGGDPNGDGTGGSETAITGEFYDNGRTNRIPHLKGVISMARANDPNSASSQFFIVHKDNRESLDGKYAAFGVVTEGMDIVDKICSSAEPIDKEGLIAEEDRPVIESITINEINTD